MGVLLSEGFIRRLVHSRDQLVGVVLNGVSNFDGEGLGAVVPSVLREGNSERQIVVDGLEVGLD